MLPKVRAIAIDDEEPHLSAIHKAATNIGLGCLPLLFPRDTENIPVEKYDSVRIVICDLHLGATDILSDDGAKYGRIAGLLDLFKFPPYTPYSLVLWTKDAGERDKLQAYLEARVPAANLPSSVEALDKNKYGIMDGSDKAKADDLWADLHRAIEKSRGLNALLAWERDVLEAADNTVRQLVGLARRRVGQQVSIDDPIDELLSLIAQKATSNNRAKEAPWSSAMAGLLPILGDELQHLELNAKRQADWTTALSRAAKGVSLSATPEQTAQLNEALLIAIDGSPTGADRGSVLDAWHPDKEFKVMFGREKADIFQIMGFEGRPEGLVRYVQIEGLCDAVQQKKGVVTFVVAVEAQADAKMLPVQEGPGARPLSIAVSPSFRNSKGEARKLVANTRLFFTLERGVAKEHRALYRLREGLVTQWAFAWATYAIRPGIISF